MWSRLKAGIEAPMEHRDGTIRKLSDLNIVKASVELDTPGRRVFALEDLNAYVDSLEPW